ncbi:MAG: HDOD domain-containing protein [Phycisphaerae bacterium]|nr:HDOD domain-containing protein [Phycisphaerae bacterium]
MQSRMVDPTVAHQVELIIHKLNSLSTLPCVAARFLSHLSQGRLSAFAETIESDPALAAKILSLAHRQKISYLGESPSVRRAIDKLPAHAVREAVLAVKVYPAFGRNEQRVLFRKQLAVHCLAVACCAEDIAELISPQIDTHLAYSAGLLHDIGKLALDETMPRSFAAIIEQANSQQASTITLEQKHLGLDHTIIGKRLAEKWHLPDEIALAIWLHHSDINLISQTIPEAKIAQVVQLADLIARQCNIGLSGSFDLPRFAGEAGSTDSANKLAQLLNISPGQLEQIRINLPEKVEQKSEILGMDSPVTADEYCNIVRTVAAQMAQKQTELVLENRRLLTALSHFDFTKEFLLSIDSSDEPIDIAENFALRWQKFYQTGMVCLYLAPKADSPFLKAVIVESPSQTKTIMLNTPADSPAVPQAIANNFAILNAQDYTDWLFEQLAVKFDLGHTKLVPLLSAGRAVGAIVFELHYPLTGESEGQPETELFEKQFKTSTSVAGAVLDLAFTCARHRRFAEQFVQSLNSPADESLANIKTPKMAALPEPAPAKSDILNALAEMAAGAAHELNNPLSVISGRSQLLAQSEADPQKKQILGQIQNNAKEISAIIDDLFVFASPPAPTPALTDHRQLLDEAIKLASKKTNVEQLNVSIEVVGNVKKLFVDSAQIAEAIANIISNAVDSYADSTGPVKITACGEPGRTACGDDTGCFVKLTIADTGCGMDAETLQKATYPFFSNLPAGRKRGMGLAHAAQLIKINAGSLNITSRTDYGTTVTILLPAH